MINANELRIGNWVIQFQTDMVENIYQQVDAILKDGAALTELNCVPFSKLEPIPLTPEILEKAGFVCDWDTYRLDIKGSGVIDWSDDGSVGIGDSRDKFLFAGNGPCKYVHQLQNLYWCLCGEELEINL